MSRQYASSDEVPNEVLAARLRELVDFITKPSKRDDERLPTEFYMRIPAEVDHDADLVMSEAARRLVAPSASAPVEVTEEMVERLAKHMAKEESTRCKTLEGALHHQAMWKRLLHEARAALTAALAGGAGGELPPGPEGEVR